jgi:hypothetical protein
MASRNAAQPDFRKLGVCGNNPDFASIENPSAHLPKVISWLKSVKFSHAKSRTNFRKNLTELE